MIDDTRLLMPWKFKTTETKSEVSIRSDCTDFLTIDCIQELPENEVAIASATKDVEELLSETNSKAAVRGLTLILPLSLTLIYLQELPENELAAIVSATKECTSVKDRVMETNSKAAVREDRFLFSHLSDAYLNPGIV